MDKDMEKRIGAPDAQIPPMAGEEEKELLLIQDLHDPAVIDGSVVTAANNMNPTGSLRCWLVVAGSVMLLTNYIQAAPKYQLIPLEPILVIFMMFIYAIFYVFRTMKQM